MKINQKNMLLIIGFLIILLSLIGYLKMQNDWILDLDDRLQLHNEMPNLIPFPQKIHFFDAIFYFIHDGVFEWMYLILPIIVIVPATFEMFNIIKSKIIIYLSNRKKYSKIIKGELLKCYLPVLIIPFLFLNIVLFSYIYSNIVQTEYMGNFIEYLELINSSMSPFSFVCMMILNLCLISIFYINVALLIIDKVKSYPLLIVFSFLLITAYQIISEVFIGILLHALTKKEIFINLFSLYNLWFYDGGVTPYMSFLYVVFLAVLSSLLVKIKYNNIEKVVNENEK